MTLVSLLFSIPATPDFVNVDPRRIGKYETDELDRS